ncbi:MAG: gamma-glutamylcyclotransferase family protein [Pseudomonadota bacterium]
MDEGEFSCDWSVLANWQELFQFLKNYPSRGVGLKAPGSFAMTASRTNSVLLGRSKRGVLTSRGENKAKLEKAGVMIKQESLFVCGALCEGMVNFEKLKGFVRRVRPALAKGSAVRLPVGYPAICLEGGDAIQGQLLDFEASETLFTILDEFHGFNPNKPEKSLMVKAVLEVVCDNLQSRASAYVLNPQRTPAKLERIPQGDWVRNLQENPPLTERLSDKQKHYIAKLGASSGREIVPIDLDLYRQLMSLEIVVDKGRRLALTKLGKELYKHL